MQTLNNYHEYDVDIFHKYRVIGLLSLKFYWAPQLKIKNTFLIKDYKVEHAISFMINIFEVRWVK